MRDGQYHFFPPFRLDPINAQLWRNSVEIALRPKTFEVLRYLVDRPGELVTKAALLDAIWPNVNVSDTTPATCVKELRKALGDEAHTPRFVETVHRRGYRFIARVTGSAEAAKVVAPKTTTGIVVGREVELDKLRDLYRQMLDGERRVVFVSGEAGIGKSVFVQRFIDGVGADEVTRIAYGQCVEHFGAGEPYMPVLEALSQLGRGPAGGRVVELLSRFAPMWLAQMPGLLKSDERARMQFQLQGVSQQRMLREITEALEAIVAEMPLLLVLEDLHWSDFSTLELISAIARRKGPMRLMIVATYRPAEVLSRSHPLRSITDELGLHSLCMDLRLKLLSKTDVSNYLSRRFSKDAAENNEALTSTIYARSEGNPLFLINIVDYLLGNSGKSMDAHGPNILKAANSLEVPDNLLRIIERNLERLQPDEQAILAGASVAGTEFSAASVAAALEREQDELEACCMRLSGREQFISMTGVIAWPDGTLTTGFRFDHTLYREVLYSRLLPSHRARFHQRIATRTEAGYGDRVHEIASELAHHYNRGQIPEKAIECFRRAAEQAIARGALKEAEEHCRAALTKLNELAPTTGRDRLDLELSITLGRILWTAKSWSHPETGRVFARAQELAEKLGENSQLMTVLFGLFLLATGNGAYHLAQSIAERMLLVAESSGSPPLLSFARVFVGETLLYSAKYHEAQKLLESANAYCESNKLQGLNEWALAAPALLAISFLISGYLDRARELGKKAQQYADHCSDPHKVGGIHLWLGFLNGMACDASQEWENANKLRSLAVKHPVWIGLADFFTANAKMLEGDWQGAEKYLDKAIVFHESVGLVGWLNWFKLTKAQVLARQGLVDSALVLAASSADHTELALLRAPALQLQAELMAQISRDKSVIESTYRSALECARDQQAKYFELQATTSFARWLKGENREVEAEKILAEVYSWFSPGSEAAALKEARTLLGELRHKPSDLRSHPKPDRTRRGASPRHKKQTPF